MELSQSLNGSRNQGGDRTLAPGVPCQPPLKGAAEVHLTVCCGTLLLAQGEPHPSLFQSSRRGQLKPEHVLIKSPAGNPADRQGQEPLARSLDFITLEKLQGHGKN